MIGVAAGSGHSCCLSADGRVFSCGRGDDGRLGHGDDSGWKYVPRPVEFLCDVPIAQVTCGSYHTACLSRSGTVYTFGGGLFGKLGHGNDKGIAIPKAVAALSGVCIAAVACGSRHTLALSEDGKVFSWGDLESGVCGLGGGGTAGEYEATSGTSGRRHHGARTASGAGPDTGASIVGAGSRDFESSSGELDTDGSAAPGSGTSSGGQVGQGTGGAAAGGNQSVPAEVVTLRGERIIGIAACGFHSAFLSDQGMVWTCGEGRFGRLGHGDEEDKDVPTHVSNFPEDCVVVEVACGGFHSACVDSKGRVWVWGGGEHGQLGLGTRSNRLQPTKVSSLDGEGVSSVACGWSHSAFLTDQGNVFACGNCDHGKLGLGTWERAVVPQKVKGLEKQRVLQIASYNEHTLVLVDEESEPGLSLAGRPMGGTAGAVISKTGSAEEALAGSKPIRAAAAATGLAASSPAGSIAPYVGASPGKRPHAWGGGMFQLSSDMGGLLESGDHSDVTFVVSARAGDSQAAKPSASSGAGTSTAAAVRFYAHKAVLSARSERFQAMFASGMAESSSGEVRVDGVNPAAFRIVLGYLYTGLVSGIRAWPSGPSGQDAGAVALDSTATPSEKKVSPASGPASAAATDSSCGDATAGDDSGQVGATLIDAFALAHEYMLHGLAESLQRHVCRHLRIDTAAELLARADQHPSAEGLQREFLQFIVRHFDAVTKTAGFMRLSKERIVEVLQMR